jgi:DNA-directed RNA polymerase specialized sigma24 family protein
MPFVENPPIRSRDEALELFNKNQALAFWGARKFFKNLEKDEADQKALILLFNVCERWKDDGRANLATYFAAAAMHGYANLKRKEDRDPMTTSASFDAPIRAEEGSEALGDFIADPREAPAALALARLEGEAILSCVNERASRILRSLSEGYSMEETAERLGLDVDQAKRALVSTRRKILRKVHTQRAGKESMEI